MYSLLAIPYSLLAILCSLLAIPCRGAPLFVFVLPLKILCRPRLPYPSASGPGTHAGTPFPPPLEALSIGNHPIGNSREGYGLGMWLIYNTSFVNTNII